MSTTQGVQYAECNSEMYGVSMLNCNKKRMIGMCVTTLGPQVFCFFSRFLGIVVLGRERSIGRSDGSTGLNFRSLSKVLPWQR